MTDVKKQKFRNENQKLFVSVSEASRISGINVNTLRSLADQGKIDSYRTPTGLRKYNRQSLETMCHLVPIVKDTTPSGRINFIYTRVSSKKQSDDLVRQIQYLESRKPAKLAFTVLQDVGSGVNFKRKGLQTILDACLQGIIGKVLIAYKDRLCRFGFELLEYIIHRAGGEIIVLNDHEDKTHEQELSEDLLSIVHIYSCKQMGKRKYRKCKKDMQKGETQIKS